MKKVSKIFIALLSCLTAVCFVLPVSAETEVEKKESVYAVLNSDGSVESITVSDSLHSDSGFNNYKDESNLKDIENLKSNDEINQSGTTLTWNTSDTDIYYQGTSDAELPLDVDITYSLDGKKMSAEQIVGQSGHLEINIKLTNNSKQKYVVDGKTYNLVTPFVTGIVGMFDDDVFKNVTIDNGKVTSDSSHNIVVGVVVPGLRSGLSQIFDASVMNKLNDYLVDEVTIEADVTEFESPTLMLAAATSSDALKDEFDDIDEFSSIFDKLDDLKEATQELIDGTNSLYNGAVKLNDGVATLKDGANTLNTGANTLYDGANSLASGASKLNSGLATLVSNNEELVSGANQIADAVLATANQQLAAKEIIKNDPKYTELTWSNYADQLSYYYGVTDAMREIVLNQIKTQLTEKSISLTDEQLNMILYMAAKDNATDLTTYMQNKAGNLRVAANVQQAKTDAASISSGTYTNVQRALILGTYEGVIGQIQDVAKNIKTADYPDGILLTTRQAEAVLISVNGNVNSINESVIASALEVSGEALGVDNEQISPIISAMKTTTGDASVYSSLNTTIKSKYDTLTDSDIAVLLTEGSEYHSTETSIASMIVAVQSDIGIANEIATNLESSKTEEGKQIIKSYLNALVKASESGSDIQALKDLETQLASVAKFKAGIKDYTDGVAECYSGSKELSSGANQLSSGAKQLKEGTSSLASGASTLKDGSNTLMEGAKTLNEGMQKYNDEGISKLTDNSSISSLEEASELLKAICEDENNYNNYSGISDGTEGSIKFVFKVNSAKKAENKEATNETTTEKVSFWQRILNLFKF